MRRYILKECMDAVELVLLVAPTPTPPSSRLSQQVLQEPAKSKGEAFGEGLVGVRTTCSPYILNRQITVQYNRNQIRGFAVMKPKEKNKTETATIRGIS